MHQLTEKMDVQIEVGEDCVTLILPRKMDDLMVPWQQAWQLGEALEQAAGDIPNKGEINPIWQEIQLSQLRINTHKDKYVILFFEHVDRIKLSYEAARIVARNIRMRAQDLDLLTRGVRMQYDTPGHKGRPMPFWEYVRKIFGAR